MFSLQVSVSIPIWLESVMQVMPMTASDFARTLPPAAISLSSNTMVHAWPTLSALNLTPLALTALLVILHVVSSLWAAMRR